MKHKEIIIEDDMMAINITQPPNWTHAVNFTVHYIALEDGHKPLYINSTANPCPTFTESPNENNALIDGYLKWDGCMELRFPSGQEHFCGLRDFSRFTRTIKRVYKEASEFMDNTDYLGELE